MGHFSNGIDRDPAAINPTRHNYAPAPIPLHENKGLTAFRLRLIVFDGAPSVHQLSGSYRLAALQNKPQVALEMGNSPEMIDKHYRRPIPESLGKEWFSIVPSA